MESSRGTWLSCSEAESQRVRRHLTHEEQGCGARAWSQWPTARQTNTVCISQVTESGRLSRRDYGGPPEPARKHGLAILGREPFTFKKVPQAIVWLMAGSLCSCRGNTSFCDFLGRVWKSGPDKFLGFVECQCHDDRNLNSVLFKHIFRA